MIKIAINTCKNSTLKSKILESNRFDQNSIHHIVFIITMILYIYLITIMPICYSTVLQVSIYSIYVFYGIFCYTNYNILVSIFNFIYLFCFFFNMFFVFRFTFYTLFPGELNQNNKTVKFSIPKITLISTITILLIATSIFLYDKDYNIKKKQSKKVQVIKTTTVGISILLVLFLMSDFKLYKSK